MGYEHHVNIKDYSSNWITHTHTHLLSIKWELYSSMMSVNRQILNSSVPETHWRSYCFIEWIRRDSEMNKSCEQHWTGAHALDLNRKITSILMDFVSVSVTVSISVSFCSIVYWNDFAFWNSPSYYVVALFYLHTDSYHSILFDS